MENIKGKFKATRGVALNGATVVDWNDGNVIQCSLTANATITFTNPPGDAAHLVMIVSNSGSYTLGWTTSVDWEGGTPLTAPTSSGDRASPSWGPASSAPRSRRPADSGDST